MIVEDSFLSKLKELGLNSYESKLWIALLSRGISTTGELSDIANVPRSRSYDVLESLEKKGFVVQKIGKPIKYVAIPPEEVLERVKKGVETDAQKQLKVLDNLRSSDVLSELSLLHSQGIEMVEPTDLTVAIKGRNNLYNHILSTIKKAEEDVLIMTSTNGFIRKAIAFKNTFKKLSSNGVKIKIFAPLNSETKKYEEELKDYAEIHHVDSINMRMCVVDQKDLTFMILDDNMVHPIYDVGVWVNSPYFGVAMKQMILASKMIAQIPNLE